MAKLDFEKARRNRLPKDICADAPWRSDFVPPSGGSHHGNHPARDRPVARTTPEPSGVADRLRAIAAELAGPDFANLPPWKKLEALAKIQARLNRVVDIHGSAIKSTQAFRLAEASCAREVRLLKRAGRRR